MNDPFACDPKQWKICKIQKSKNMKIPKLVKNLKKSRKFQTYHFLICSYIRKMTLDLIETLKTSIYNPKHINNTKNYFRKVKVCVCVFVGGGRGKGL